MTEFHIKIPCSQEEKWTVHQCMRVSNGKLAHGKLGIRQMLQMMSLCDSVQMY